MQCAHCATPVPDDARFCHSCGSLVSDAEGAARVSGSMTQDSFDKIEELLRKETEGQYVIQRLLGKGGMAVVYLAREVHLARDVAIKVLPPELTFGHGVERFKREAKTAAALDHPNIIPVYRVSTEGTLFWYAMKYLEGQSLEQLLKDRGKLPPDLTVKILRQVADALDYAHERKVVHRDMKPANVMLDRRHRVIVTDFGIAKALSEGTLTASGSVIGTPYFMSPEQGMGKVVSGASDQYSVAVMAYRMLAGRVPFEGDSAIDVLHKHCMVQPPPLENAAPGLPRHVYLAVHRALDKKAENRFPTVGDFVHALESAEALGASAPHLSLGGTGAGDATLVVPTGGVSTSDLATTPLPSLGHSMPGVDDRTMATPPPAPPTPQTIPPSSSLRIVRKKRSPAGFIAAGLIVIGGGAAGVYFATRGGGAPEPLPPDTVVQAPVAVQAPPAASPQPPAADTTPAAPPTQVQQPVTEPPRTQTEPARPTPPPPRTGTLVIQGMPQEAVVTVDGRVQPGPRIDLSPGRHSIRIVHPDYEQHNETVAVRAGDVTTVLFRARPIVRAAPSQPPPAAPPQTQPQVREPARLLEGQAILLLSVTPVAEIFISGESRGVKSRLVDTTLAGGISVRLVPTDRSYADSSFAISLVPGRNEPVVIRLRRR